MASSRPKFKALALIISLSLPGLWLALAAWLRRQIKTFSLTILHSNDLHSHEDSFLEEKDVGGMPRIAHLIRAAKKNNPNVLAVDAGDIFQGTGYFELYKGETDVECLNLGGYNILHHGQPRQDLTRDRQIWASSSSGAKFDVVNCNLDVSSKNLI